MVEERFLCSLNRCVYDGLNTQERCTREREAEGDIGKFARWREVYAG
jgi:hypothetical protein